ncbi:extracellular solute-binding protein [candidate division KSB3 bacterium]|uniref:Extracellular solute-binding protein n=1 Tax=candidate division KSB3 bacterium TaxID=2044937 RepID=A0A9D5Q6A1_9BACT|nr:extracellular solute-binding protein [candidate division KSB3 bacterium]MBD3324706.1 extracellular solute-binding protein [candidate division KSB3 bacterium]
MFHESRRKIMMRTKIVWMLIALLCAGSLLLAGGTADAQDKLSIWLGYGETLPAFEFVKAKFEEKYPDIEVEILTFSLRDFEAKLASSMPTGAGPDLLALHDFLFPRYYDNDYLEPLPDDLAQIVTDPEKMNQTYTDIVSREGVAYGVPYWTGRSTLFYNLDHFEEAGLSGPPETVEQLWEYAEKLVQKDASGEVTRAGITMRLTGPSGGIQKFGYLYYQMAGEQIFEPGEEPGTVRVTLEDNLDIAVQALLDRVNHLHGERKVDDWTLKHDAQGFASGVASMLLRETWAIAFIKKNGPDINFSTALMPKGKVRGAFNYIEILSVSNQSELKEETWEFIRMLQEQEALNVLLTESGYSPLRRDRDFAWFVEENPKYKAVMQDFEGYQQYLEAPNTAYEEMTTRVGEVLQEAYRDAALVDNPEGCKEVILEMQEVAEDILSFNGILAE